MKLPYFKWYPKDFEVDENVKLMTLEEIGLYALCLNHAWINGSLPADPSEIARAMKVPPKAFSRIWLRVAPCFVAAPEPGRLINVRQEKERALAISKSESASRAVRIRYERNTEETPRALARAGSVSVSGSGEVNQETNSFPTWQADAGFCAFRDAYLGIGAVAIVTDWPKAFLKWRLLDFEQKAQAVVNIKTCDPAHAKLPQNYLADREFTRPPRPAQRKPIEESPNPNADDYVARIKAEK